MKPRNVACALDPVLFAHHAGFPDLDPWQAALLRSGSRQIMLCCSRQSGKSSMTALLGLHQALFVPGSLVLLLAPALRQSSELHKKVKQAYNKVSFSSVAVTRETELQLEFANGSRIIALPGRDQTLRGYSAQLLVIDEAARVSDELYYGVRPMLAVSRGRIILLSTPFGKRGFFHHEWVQGEGWERVKIPATMCPRLDARWLAQERAAIGPWWYAQEYECQFVETEDQVFSYDMIQRAFTNEFTPLNIRRPYA